MNKVLRLIYLPINILFWFILKIISFQNYFSGTLNSFKSWFNARGKKNEIICKSLVCRSNIQIFGESNKFICGTGILNNCLIRMSGISNIVEIEDNETISNLTIHVRGENNVIKIGKGTSIGGARIINVGIKNSVTIGNSCMLSDNIEIWASDSHPIYSTKTNEIINSEQPITIGNKVWIGTHVKILKGAIIEDDSIIAMGTILTGKVPNNTVFGGNPNRILKQDVFWNKFCPNKLLY
jgi:acetyltransferase-like isoleucine patch superfamily enzyme